MINQNYSFIFCFPIPFGKIKRLSENIKAIITEFVCLSASEFTNSSMFALMFEQFDFSAGCTFLCNFLLYKQKKVNHLF